jgi:hypothetical protein
LRLQKSTVNEIEGAVTELMDKIKSDNAGTSN